MKLRVRINRQTSRVELLGEEPSLKELKDHIKETVLSSHGLRSDIGPETGLRFLITKPTSYEIIVERHGRSSDGIINQEESKQQNYFDFQ